LIEELKTRGASIPLVVGGIIPTSDHQALRSIGVAAVFGPESPLTAVVETVRALAAGQALPEPIKPQPAGIPATRLDHGAICVKDIDASIALMEEVLGQKVAHREYVDAQKVDAAFFDFPNGASLELVCPRGNAALEKFLDKRGDALHHLALRVKDIDGVLLRLAARGVPLIDKTGRPGARGHRVAFLHPKAFGGTLLELVEAHGEEPT
jgi:methylmalonyl-CoA epimerase